MNFNLHQKIKKVAVLGSGVMGSQIACHFANIGLDVLLLDLAKDGKNIADIALGAALKSNPSPIYSKKFAGRIKTGNFDDDLSKIKDCDWVIEVVIERLDIKKSLFEKVEQHRKTGSLITSNTSGIPIEMMLEGRSEDFAAHFCGTHFFNPPRYLKLLEIIPSSKTKPEVIDFFLHYGDLFLGKTTVLCKDTPAFIANRIGVFSIMAIFKMMQKHGLSIEAVDTITGPISGRPKSATFRTSDLVGLDTLVKVAQGVGQNCSQDEMKDWFAIPEFLNKMLKNNWLGDKTGQGFYKKSKDSKGNRTIEALDLQTLEYKPQDKPRYDSIGKAKQANRLKSKLGILYDGGDAAADFYQQAIADEDAFISNYRNKAVSINGEIIEITGSGIQMAPGILLSTLENSGAVALGDVITCKGRMVGIEEDLLTGDLLIRLDECSCD